MDRIIHAELWSLPTIAVLTSVRRAGFARMPMAMQAKVHGHGPAKTVMRLVRRILTGPTGLPLISQPTTIGTRPVQHRPLIRALLGISLAQQATELEAQDLA